MCEKGKLCQSEMHAASEMQAELCGRPLYRINHRQQTVSKHNPLLITLGRLYLVVPKRKIIVPKFINTLVVSCNCFYHRI
jgi:hypothetical protein